MVRCKVQAEAFVLMGKNLTCSVKHKVLSKSDKQGPVLRGCLGTAEKGGFVTSLNEEPIIKL
jgi:hypothetical protein